MCGIAGALQPGGATQLQAMLDRLGHRGPDGSGLWRDDDAGIGLAHTRLAILDLSEAGRQPMTSPSGRYIVTYNGEIYNHLKLRDDLARACQPAWLGHSDTETLVVAIDIWGLQETLSRIDGMFAFALWDREDRKLTLVRDRLGEKPLYFGRANGVLLFGSDLHALRAHAAFDSRISRHALSLLVRYNYVPAPLSIFERYRKVRPGTALTVDLDGNEAEQIYWSVDQTGQGARSMPSERDHGDAVDRLEELLSASVGQQMISDVPLGAFLSGGIDSSTVVALMQAQSGTRVKTFTIGFDAPGHDESRYARSVAAHLGTEHTELTVTPDDALAIIPELPSIYSEPFADSSQIPTHLVSRLARQHVTVALSGDGGDELFGGYNRHILTHRLWPRISTQPVIARRLAAAAISAVAPAAWDRVSHLLQRRMGAAERLASFGDKMHKAALVLGARTPEEAYGKLVTRWRGANIVSDNDGLPEGRQWPLLGPAEAMMVQDMQTYLPDDILCKVDRAAMACSLETRVPMLGRQVVEFALSLHVGSKIADGRGKRILRDVLRRHVPDSLIERPKMGFALPLGAWLKGPLRDWADALLSPARLTREGYFRAELVQRAWRRHLSGAENLQDELWSVLMFQAWLDHAF